MTDGRSPLERGLEAGYRCAEAHPEDRARLRTIARARTASGVRAALAAADPEPPQLDGSVASCSGFAHGVAKYLIESS